MCYSNKVERAFVVVSTSRTNLPPRIEGPHPPGRPVKPSVLGVTMKRNEVTTYFQVGSIATVSDHCRHTEHMAPKRKC